MATTTIDDTRMKCTCNDVCSWFCDLTRCHRFKYTHSVCQKLINPKHIKFVWEVNVIYRFKSVNVCINLWEWIDLCTALTEMLLITLWRNYANTRKRTQDKVHINSCRKSKYGWRDWVRLCSVRNRGILTNKVKLIRPQTWLNSVSRKFNDKFISEFLYFPCKLRLKSNDNPNVKILNNVLYLMARDSFHLTLS